MHCGFAGQIPRWIQDHLFILSFTGGIYPCQELEKRGPGYHLPRGLVNHPIFQLTALVCFGRSPS